MSRRIGLRGAFSLLEVLIALSMFTIVMAAVLSTLSSVAAFTRTEGATNDLTLEGQRALKRLVNDLGDSAWMIEAAYQNTLVSPATDRASRYFPYVIVQAPSGVPTSATTMSAWSRLGTPSLVPAWTNSWFAQLPAENRMQSQELVFLKVTRCKPAAAPAPTTDRVNYNLKWDGTALPTAGDWRTGVLPMSNYQNGIKVDSLIVAYNPASKEVIDTPMVFETYPTSPNLGFSDTIDRNNPDYLREYSFVVVPDASTGKNMLVRCWRNGKTASPVFPPNAPNANAGYDIISEYVDRLVIDTYRTLSSLDVNQVRIRLYLSKETYDPLAPRFITTKVECLTALRSTVDPNYSLNLGTWLGPAGTTQKTLDTEQTGGVQ